MNRLEKVANMVFLALVAWATMFVVSTALYAVFG